MKETYGVWVTYRPHADEPKQHWHGRGNWALGSGSVFATTSLGVANAEAERRQQSETKWNFQVMRFALDGRPIPLSEEAKRSISRASRTCPLVETDPQFGAEPCTRWAPCERCKPKPPA